jgi:hypothetical protein
MRWMSALFLCGFMAMVMAFAPESRPSLALEHIPPSSLARETFCPREAPDPLPALWATDGRLDQRVVFAPDEEQAGSAYVRDIISPYPDPAPDSGWLVLTVVTLPANTCIIESFFYPSMVMTVTSGNMSILVEHVPGVGNAPEVSIDSGGDGAAQSIAIDTPTAVAAGDWITIENEAHVGFRNETGQPAIFTVAGIKMAEDPGGGGGHRGRP